MTMNGDLHRLIQLEVDAQMSPRLAETNRRIEDLALAVAALAATQQTAPDSSADAEAELLEAAEVEVAAALEEDGELEGVGEEEGSEEGAEEQEILEEVEAVAEMVAADASFDAAPARLPWLNRPLFGRRGE